MTDKQMEIISKMEKIHDEIKKHPFRIGFSIEDIPSYKHLLYELTEAWVSLIYKSDATFTGDQKLDRQFGGWIHDYRQELRTYKKDTFPMEFFDYYEKMLQITHRFIETGEVDEFYNIDPFWDGDKRFFKVEKYELITKEKTGFDSPILPHFLPVKYPLDANEERVRNYYLTYWTFPDKSEEVRLQEFEYWKQNIKPVILWLHENRVEERLMHNTWMSAIK